jgi:hypothetical protein
MSPPCKPAFVPGVPLASVPRISSPPATSRPPPPPPRLAPRRAAAMCTSGSPAPVPADARPAPPPLPGAEVPPWAADLTLTELLAVVRGESSDARVNELARGLLGWTAGPDGAYCADGVPEAWAGAYPDGPPDFIGSADDYSPAADRPVKRAVQRLTREVPAEDKQALKEVLGPLGFGGWTVAELTPNRTRRATVANWVLYYCRARGVAVRR